MAATENNDEGRTGYYTRQPGGYRAFVPVALPYDPPVRIDGELLRLLSRADQAIGRLDAASDMLPNPDLFVEMYVTKEAVLSSKIEGVTQASLGEVLEHEARRGRRGVRADIDEVWNYVEAMNYGLDRVEGLPLSGRLIREIHSLLLRDVRGEDKLPGQFRTTQNWVGPPGCDLGTSTFVPPPPHLVMQAIGELEHYIHDDTHTPVLLRAGLIHCQFETIHPFLDGNGRIGRLLVVFYLCQKGVLKRPLLYLSAFFETHKDEYYERLQAVRDHGDVEGWLKFFLTATWKVSEAAAETAREILRMRESHRSGIQAMLSGSVKGVELLDYLFATPYTTVSRAANSLDVSYPTANNLVDSFVRVGILDEVTGQDRNRIFAYTPYLELMDEGLEDRSEPQKVSP